MHNELKKHVPERKDRSIGSPLATSPPPPHASKWTVDKEWLKGILWNKHPFCLLILILWHSFDPQQTILSSHKHTDHTLFGIHMLTFMHVQTGPFFLPQAMSNSKLTNICNFIVVCSCGVNGLTEIYFRPTVLLQC